MALRQDRSPPWSLNGETRTMTPTSYWLMKAEPESRLEKGIDVKFSIDDLKEMDVSPWDGVRNHEAKNLMKNRMKLDDKVLFYHSNCKTPGVYGTATIAKEGYPDHTAWDEKHPYYDKKSKKDNPTWFMVDVKYESHLVNPMTLSLFKTLATATDLPDCVEYIGGDGWEAIRGMPLVNRGRLSVQPVSEEAYRAVLHLGEEGGWESLEPKKRKSSLKRPLERLSDGEADATTGNGKGTGELRKSTRGAKKEGKKRVRISEAAKANEAEESELSDLPEDRIQPSTANKTGNGSKKTEASKIENGGTRKSSRKR